MKIAFIGYGNMSKSIISGILNSKLALKKDIYVFEVKNYRPDKLISKKNFLKSGSQCAIKFDLIFLCIKPQDMKNALLLNKHIFRDFSLVISIMAGVKVSSVKSLILQKIKIVRCMPNILATIKKSININYFSGKFLLKEKKLINRILKSFGSNYEVKKESEINAFTAISGSGPAYVTYLLEALVTANQSLGATKRQSEEIALSLFKDTIAMIDNDFSLKKIQNLQKQITSKGGTTEAALKVFNKKRLSNILKQGMKEGKKRADMLGKIN